MNNIKQIVVVAVAVLMATFLSGCKDPETGKDLYLGSLRVVSEYYSGPFSAIVVYSGANQTGDIKWQSNGVTMNGGDEFIFSDVPAGLWCVRVASKHINNVKIAFGMTTTINVDAGFNLTAGVPLP